MQSKSLLIAIAAFAVTATGVQAYGGADILDRAGLSEEQKTAIHTAQELRSHGDVTAARDLLVEAGIDEDTLLSLHHAAQEARVTMRDAIKDGDYAAFKTAVADSPLADIITSKDDFTQFKEAHELRQNGEWEEAHVLLDELGVDTHKRNAHHKEAGKGFLSQLSVEQREVLQVARQANDRATMQAIFDEAGVETGPYKGR